MTSQIASFAPCNFKLYKQDQLSKESDANPKNKRSAEIQSLASDHLKPSSYRTKLNLESRSYEKIDIQQTPSLTQLQNNSVLILNDKLFEAIATDNLKAVQALIDEGADVNAKLGRDLKGFSSADTFKTSLMLASKYGNADIAKALIKAGARVNDTDSIWSATALMEAAQNDHADIIEILVASGANLEARNALGFTALLKAARGKTPGYNKDTTINAIRSLIKLGADVNAKDTTTESTALMEAAECNHVNTIKLLIASGADIHITNYFGETAFDVAERSGAIAAGDILYALRNS